MALTLTIVSLLLAAPSAHAQEPATPSIIVVGQGEARAAPDRFVVDAALTGRGATPDEALRALAAKQSVLLERWPRLDGLRQASVVTSDIAVEPVRDFECERNSGRNEDCPPLSYLVRVGATLEGAPADRAGDAVSLASELGAESVGLDEYRLADPRELAARANTAAFVDARRQAETLAAASGGTLGRLIRIQDPSAEGVGNETSAFVGEITVTGSRVRPAVSITAAPEPIVARTRVTVVFELD